MHVLQDRLDMACQGVYHACSMCRFVPSNVVSSSGTGYSASSPAKGDGVASEGWQDFLNQLHHPHFVYLHARTSFFQMAVLVASQ